MWLTFSPHVGWQSGSSDGAAIATVPWRGGCAARSVTANMIAVLSRRALPHEALPALDSLGGIALLIIKTSMAIVLFLMGIASFGAGMLIIMSREYQETLKTVSSHSAKISGKAITDEGVAPTIEAASRLVESVAKLIQTAVGVGAFLSILGIAVSVIAYWMLSNA